MSSKKLGKRPAGERLKRIQASPNYKNGSFQNLSVTPVMAEDTSFWKTLRDFMHKPADTTPSKPLPTLKPDLLHLPDGDPVIVWFGHSSYYIKINGKSILVDPVFGKNASPVPFMISAFKGTGNFSVADFPAIDMVILTHDHYDHMDYPTILQLKDKAKHFYTSLGVGAHLEYWGIDTNKITEFDWWESAAVDENMQLTAAPGRHFSGRGIKRGQTLWSSFILKTPDYNLFIGGDSGYDTHFKTIGDKFGPFDLAILECGQYNKSWPNIHMMPEETVQAAIDLKAKILLPVHWGKFSLALHPWKEPVTRVIQKAGAENVRLITPMIGETVVLGKDYPDKEWWSNL